MKIRKTCTLESLGEFRKKAVKGNYEVFLYSYIVTIETMDGPIRQAKVGYTASPYEMRCYKRALSDKIAFLNIRVESPVVAAILTEWKKGKLTPKQAQNLLEPIVETPVHDALEANGFTKDGENFRKDNFTFNDIKNIAMGVL
jgi:hypothetical protein